jgi:hypothetical protein
MRLLSYLRSATALLLILGVLEPQHVRLSDVVGAFSQETPAGAAVVVPPSLFACAAAKAASPPPPAASGPAKKHHRTRIADSKSAKDKRREAHVDGLAQKQTERTARTNTVHMNRDNMEQTKRRHADL